ncbi:unnamed protein product [Tuber aestivum]|uniref:Uncharacterized protein n=1 Tax=Tuber aestivum TaxID=59557 RepID=A0A292PZI1_9PEZI|nr:unnamed protein product [Tuber aestivum]
MPALCPQLHSSPSSSRTLQELEQKNRQRGAGVSMQPEEMSSQVTDEAVASEDIKDDDSIDYTDSEGRSTSSSSASLDDADLAPLTLIDAPFGQILWEDRGLFEGNDDDTILTYSLDCLVLVALVARRTLGTRAWKIGAMVRQWMWIWLYRQ